MTSSRLESLPSSGKSVVCPRCGLPCSLMPLRRPGAYRLVDQDGHGHAAVCLGAASAPKPIVRYRPVVMPPQPSAAARRPLPVTARRA
jgi:hypothetical protein